METTKVKMPKNIPPQHQERQPGIESDMHPAPVYDNDDPGLGRLKGKVAVITGGDSGIGRAVAVQFAKEGAEVVIAYLEEEGDAEETAEAVRKYGQEPLLIAADVSQETECKVIVDDTVARFGRIDIVVNNAAVQYEQKNLEDIAADQLEHTFKVNIFAHFYLTKYALPHMRSGSTIINTASITAYRGSPHLMDYAATKGAIVAFTRSLSQAIADRGIRVNAVAPGPVWTPLIPASFDDDKVAEFGKDTTMKRPAQPVEIAPCYVFLASKESAFITGQVLHPNGGTVVNT